MKRVIPVGTLVLWRNKYLRTVVSSSPGYVKFAIRHRSWTNRIYTVYTINELITLGCKILKNKIRRPCLKSEVEVLKKARFDIRRELKRELKEAKDTAARLGRRVCPGWSRLKRLT